jgi:acyl-CoA dehydrogenase
MTFDTIEESAEVREIRGAVAKLCSAFPGEYWRKLDREMAYPAEFVQALTEAGFLWVLIPEEYGGAGLPLSAAAAIVEEIQRAGCNGSACHAQMYTMGTVLRHGGQEQKAKWLRKIASGELRMQAFGVTEPTSGTDTSSIKTFARRNGGENADCGTAHTSSERWPAFHPFLCTGARICGRLGCCQIPECFGAISCWNA